MNKGKISVKICFLAIGIIVTGLFIETINISGGSALNPAQNAFVYLDWSDENHSMSNMTLTNASGYYEMNVAKGMINISTGMGFKRGNEFLMIGNWSGNFSISGTKWFNFTLFMPVEDAKIYGHIYDNQTHNIIEANVSIYFEAFNKKYAGLNYTITENGYYEICLPASKVFIDVSSDGYSPSFHNLSIIAGEEKEVDFYLDASPPVPPLTAWVIGYVKSTNGQPVENASVVVSIYNDSYNYTYYNFNFTSSTGYFKFKVPAGDGDVIASADNFFSNFSDVSVSEGETVWANITLQPLPPDNAWVTGFVYDNNGHPIPNANVSVQGSISIMLSNQAYFERYGTTDSNGYYNISVPAIEYVGVPWPPMPMNVSTIDAVYASADDYFDNGTILTQPSNIIEPGQTMQVNVTLDPMPPENCTVKGYVYIVAPPQPEKHIHYVGGAGAGNYTSIQDAINAASNGDTIKVYPGTYDGPIVINKEIKLVGDPAIDGHGDYGIKIEANNTLVENFTVFNCSIGILAYNSSFLLHNVTVNNCTSYNCTDGIKFYYVKESIINASYVHNCTSNGIYLENSYNNNITACIIENITGVNEYAIHLRNANDNRVEDNKIFMKDTFGGIGISNSKRNIVIGNTITGEGDNSYGIIIWEGGSRNNKILNNSIYDISYAGIALGYSSNNEIRNNIVDVSGDGIQFQGGGCRNNTVENNKVKSGGEGIYLGMNTPDFMDNKILNNTIEAYNGIYLKRCRNGTFMGNVIKTTNYAIYIENSSENDFINNTIGITRISFSYNGDLWIKNASLPSAEPSHWKNIGKFIEIENMSNAWIFIKIYYDDSDVFGVIEDTLKIWKYNGGWQEEGWNGSRYLNTAENVVGVNITSFSIFAPLGHKVKYVERGPIRINGNNEFTSENGVIGGSGTSDDPYIIEGWKINGTGYGNCIYIGNTTAYFIIRNCYLHNASGNFGIYYKNSNVYLYNVDNGRIDNCTIENAEENGIDVRYGTPQNIVIANNTIRYNNGWGIYIEGGLNNIIGNNTIYGVSAYYDAIYVHSSESQKILNNTIYNSGIRISGWLEDFTTHVISGNTVNGKPVYYFKNTSGFTVPSDAGQLILANCSDTTIPGLHISNTSVAILLGFCSNITIENCMFNNTFTAVYLDKSDDCVITNNIFTGYNRIGYGVYVGGNENIMKDNYFTDLYMGISVQYDPVNNEIKFNTIVSCDYGIYLWATDCNTIVYNTIQNCVTWGICVGSWCENNVIYHNNFIDNGGTKQAHDSTGNNTWDNGYPSGGNYWSDFDEASEGAYDNNSDGIVDSPYSISGGDSKDRYPLTMPSVVYVDDDYDASTAGWNVTHFASIQEAIDAVAIEGIIRVYGGIYEESLNISKSIVMQVNSTAKIISSRNYTIFINATNVSINGFEIENDGHGSWWGNPYSAIRIENAENVTISECQLLTNGSNNFAILIIGSNNITIKNNNITTFKHNGLGIAIWNSPKYVKIIDNEISIHYGGGYGIWTWYGPAHNVIIANNTIIHHYTGLSNAYGMWISLKDSKIENNMVITYGDNAHALWMQWSDGNIIANNTFITNLSTQSLAIKLENSYSNTFINNSINGVLISFNYYGDIEIKGVAEEEKPSLPERWEDIGKFLEINGSNWLNLTIYYSDEDINGLNESNMIIWKYNGTWHELPSILNEDENYIITNITSFSIFAPLAMPINHLPYATNPTPANGSIDVSTNPTLSVVVHDADGDKLTVIFYDASDASVIGTVDNVAAGSTASVTWPNLQYSTTYYWYVIVNDGFEEITSNLWHFTTKANSPPSTPSLSGITSGYTDSSITFYAVSTDPDGDKIKYGFDWNNDDIVDEWTSLYNSGATASRSHSWSSEGTYYLKVKAQDEYGMESDWSNVLQITITTYIPSNNPPNVEITSPLNGGVVSGIITIQGKAWDEDGNETIVKVEIRIDGNWITASGLENWSYNLDTTKLSNGEHKIEARCYDGEDYSNIASIIVTVNNVVNHPPNIEIIEPANGSTVKGSIFIKGKAWDEDGNSTIQKVEIRIDGNEWKKATGNISWAYTLDTTKLSNGEHKIEARCYDGTTYSNIASIKISVQNEEEKGMSATLIAGIIIAIVAIGIAIWLLKRK